MISDAAIEELAAVCPGAKAYVEQGLEYIHLPKLDLPEGYPQSVVEGLLCLSPREGYPTRLFLSERIDGKGANWNVYHILDKTWHSWSWNYVDGNGRPLEALAQHLKALR